MTLESGMTLEKLFTPMKAGSLDLPNRIWMAPMTRSRAGQPGDVPTELNARYYAQHASAGLIISEGSQVSKQGQGYAWTPGIYTDAQVAGWRKVTEAVHAAGGRIAIQLWHVGRISHHLLQENGAAPVAPSAIQAKSQSFVVLPDGTPSNVPCDPPRALETDEIPGMIAQFRAAARRAREAGFDMAEIHGANGYLVNQFLATGTNQRTDAYGGSLENRARFALEVVDAVAAELGADRVGIRLSPFGVFNDMTDDEAEPMAYYLSEQLGKRGIAFLHIAEPDWAGGPPLTDAFRTGLRQRFGGTLVFAGGYTAEKAENLIARGIADAVAFGRVFLANPDLPERFRRHAPLNEPDPATFYGGGEKGYTDYPTLTG